MAPRKDGTAREAGAISLSQVSTNFGHSTARLRRIKKIQFGIINPEELKQYSVTQAITVNGRKIPAGITRYEVCVYIYRIYTIFYRTHALFVVGCVVTRNRGREGSGAWEGGERGKGWRIFSRLSI